MRRRRLLAIVLALVATVPSGFFAAIMTDTIRLGPTQYTLPADAMTVALEVHWMKQSENSSLSDFYTILVTVWNHVFESSVRPYGVDVLIRLPNASLWSWWPQNPSFSADQEVVTSDDGTLLLLPAGQILTLVNPTASIPGVSTMEWSARGESNSGSVSVLDDHAQFYIANVALPKGSSVRTNATVTLEWDYHGSIQTYPVASRTVTVDFVMRSVPLST